MIFAQYKHAITFALAMLALAVVVADPGNDEADGPAAAVAPVAAVPAQQGSPVPAVAAADPEWYGAPTDGAELAVTPEDVAAVEGGADAGYDIAPTPATSSARTSHPAAAPAPAAQDSTYVPPPPPPQNFRP